MLTDPVLKIRNLSLQPHPSTCNPCSVLCPLPRCPFCAGNDTRIVTYYMKNAYKGVILTTVEFNDSLSNQDYTDLTSGQQQADITGKDVEDSERN